MKIRILHSNSSMQRQSYIYILTNKKKTVLYIGVTSNLQKRIEEHINGTGSAFAGKYKLKTLVYFEVFDDITICNPKRKIS